jgi:hypothetical protein
METIYSVSDSGKEPFNPFRTQNNKKPATYTLFLAFSHEKKPNKQVALLENKFNNRCILLDFRLLI